MRPKGRTVRCVEDERGREHEFGGEDVHLDTTAAKRLSRATRARQDQRSRRDGGSRVGRDGTILDRWRDGVDKQLPVRPKVRAGERCVRRTWRGTRGSVGTLTFTLKYDGGDAWGVAVERHGTSSSDGITSSGVLSSDGNRSGARRCSTRPMAGRRGQAASTAEGSNTVKGASDGRGGEHEFGRGHDVHAGYDGSDAWWIRQR